MIVVQPRMTTEGRLFGCIWHKADFKVREKVKQEARYRPVGRMQHQVKLYIVHDTTN